MVFEQFILFSFQLLSLSFSFGCWLLNCFVCHFPVYRKREQNQRRVKAKASLYVLWIKHYIVWHAGSVVTQTLDAFIRPWTMLSDKFLLRFDWIRGRYLPILSPLIRCTLLRYFTIKCRALYVSRFYYIYCLFLLLFYVFLCEKFILRWIICAARNFFRWMLAKHKQYVYQLVMLHEKIPLNVVQ